MDIGNAASPTLKALSLAASARMNLKNGTGKAALEMATKAVAAEKNADSLGALAAADARLGDTRAANAAADQAIAAGATNAAAHAGKGDAQMASGQAVEAVAEYRKAVELDPKNATAYTGLAYALVAAGKATEGRAAALKATEIDKNSGPAFASLGYAISAEKNFNGADASWSDAIAQAQQGAFLAPKNPQVHMVVAKLFEARGNYDQAAVAYQNALNADAGSFERLVATTRRGSSFDTRVARLRLLAQGNAGALATGLRDAAEDEPFYTVRFVRQLIEKLEAEEVDVRRANVPLIRLLVQVLDAVVSKSAAGSAHARGAEELLGRTQALLEALKAFEPNVGGKARALSPTHEAFAGNIRLAPTDPLPWPFAVPEPEAPSAFTPIVLTPVEWRDDFGGLVFGWRLTE